VTVTVAVDGMGGDNAPAEIVAGVRVAASEGVRVLICGDRARLEAEPGIGEPGIEIVDATDVISSTEEPVAAVRAKPDSSMVVACRLVRDGSAAAVVSAGSTGAMLAASLLHVGRIRGISRPGIGVPLPAQGAPCLLIDSGANVDSRAENLLQFGIMGSQFMRDVMGVEQPEVGLLSIGEEPGKGNVVTVEAHQLLAAAEGLNFAGNCEGRDVLSGRFQVLVADGFAGNVLLKGLEGAAAALLREVRQAAESSLRARIGGLLLRPALREMRGRTEPDNYGGAYLLGLRGIVVIAHGNARPKGIANAIRIAARGVEADVVARVAERLAAGRPTSDLQAPAGINTVPQVTAPEIGDQ
jgi:glycerol-3-phosphate acyltransferase PlsX